MFNEKITVSYGRKYSKGAILLRLLSASRGIILGNRYPSYRFIPMSAARVVPFWVSRWRDATVAENNLRRRQRVKATTSQEECYSPRGSRNRFAGTDLCSKYLQDEPPRSVPPLMDWTTCRASRR